MKVAEPSALIMTTNIPRCTSARRKASSSASSAARRATSSSSSWTTATAPSTKPANGADFESLDEGTAIKQGSSPSAYAASRLTGTLKSAISALSAGPKITSSFCPLPSDIIQRSLSVDSVFCKSAVSAGYLSESQLRHAASRYRLGATKDGGVIFWEIDDQQHVHSGKIMYYQPDCHRDKSHTPTWVHSLMKDKLPANYELQHCLFGLHLLGHTEITESTESSSPVKKNISAISFISAGQNQSAGPKKIAIVESEKTAVILSELFPDFLWLSCGGLQMFKPELLAPLVHHKVIIFPDTDETGEAYKAWLTVLQQAQRQYPFKYPLRISNLLEQRATPDQKQRKIDLADYLFESLADLTDSAD